MTKIQIAEKGKAIKEYEDGFIIAGDGFYEKKSSDWITHMTRVKNIDELPSLNENVFLKLTMPKMPMGIVLDAWKFFRQVSQTHNSEAVGLIVYDDIKYKFIIPEQEVTSASLDYISEGIYNVIGTIHSHNKMSAFHSGTDDADESQFDGIHITMGDMDKISFPSFSCSVTKNGERFMFSLDEMIDFTNATSELDILEAMKKVKKKSYVNTQNNKTYTKYGSTKLEDWDDYDDMSYGKYKKDRYKKDKDIDIEDVIDEDVPGSDFSEWYNKTRDKVSRCK